ncbi:Methyltransferase-like protein 7B [Hondaea fermentalgiana]|uniref:Methyltransferase-like protein 7B n=1 Tax=Hondaea fermentalgiana TaxID=2315210 RepID=A0A2R5GK38_9STRA|nr:Methyltransferase-like protein 7B [Hondaea fermentalgiana]|eukprot:GBG30689.1 Methyltransferase-like protein 7B [Hondaea fermentalgiana]
MACVQRPGFGHERKLKQDLVRESPLVSSIKLLIPLMVFPLMFIAAFYKILPLMIVYLGVSLGLGYYFAQSNVDFVISLSRPSFESASEHSLGALRSQLLLGLRGKVLDLSPGSSYALHAYYTAPKNKVTSVTTFETNDTLRKLAERRAAAMQERHGVPTRIVQGVSRDNFLQKQLEEQGESSQDVIVSYAFLNQVSDTAEQVELIFKLLRPGGTLVFMESEPYDEDTLDRMLQSLFRGIYKTLSNGTDCMRPILPVLQQQTGWDVLVTSIEASELLFSSNLKMGYAIKKATGSEAEPTSL